MRTGRKLFQFIVYLTAFGMQTCAQPNKNDIETFDQYRTQHLDSKDSLFIIYTIKEWTKKNWYTFSDYSKIYRMSNNEIEYFFGGAFYSPDRKKILVWIGQKKPNSNTIEKYSNNNEANRICPNAGDTVFSMTALIGFRDSINKKWNLFPFNQQQATCFSSKEKAINVLGRYYFFTMKTHQMYRMMQSGKNKGHKVLQSYGYNLQDSDFWNKCWLFQKDTVGSNGLYPFEIKGYDYKGEKCTKKCAVPYNPPNITYPYDY